MSAVTAFRWAEHLELDVPLELDGEDGVLPPRAIHLGDQWRRRARGLERDDFVRLAGRIGPVVVVTFSLAGVVRSGHLPAVLAELRSREEPEGSPHPTEHGFAVYGRRVSRRDDSRILVIDVVDWPSEPGSEDV